MGTATNDKKMPVNLRVLGTALIGRSFEKSKQTN